MEIKPIKNKDGKVKTNIEMVREVDTYWQKLVNGSDEDKILLSKITNGNLDIVDYVHEIASIENDKLAQDKLVNSLIYAQPNKNI